VDRCLPNQRSEEREKKRFDLDLKKKVKRLLPVETGARTYVWLKSKIERAGAAVW
jgi:hypothetical protein